MGNIDNGGLGIKKWVGVLESGNGEWGENVVGNDKECEWVQVGVGK